MSPFTIITEPKTTSPNTLTDSALAERARAKQALAYALLSGGRLPPPDGKSPATNIDIVEEIRLAVIQSQLTFLDEEASKGGLGSPLVTSISKAITLAEIYGNIEAKVYARSKDEFLDASLLLYKLQGAGKGTYDMERSSLEFSNGSAVTIVRDFK